MTIETPAELQAEIKRGATSQTWSEIHVCSSAISNESLRHVDFHRIVLRENETVRKLDWERVRIKHLVCNHLIFEDCNFEHVDLTITPLKSERLTCTFINCRFTRCNINMSGDVAVYFRRCNHFERSSLEVESNTKARMHFRECNLSRAKFYRALSSVSGESVSLAGSSFVNCVGLWGPAGVDLSHAVNQDKAIIGSDLDRWFKCISWRHIKFVGNVRAFSSSYYAVLALIIYAWAARWWAMQVEEIQGVANLSSHWVHAVKRLPIPFRFGLLLGSLLLLGFASTFYRWRCPDIVQEHSRSKWSDELGKPILSYDAASYSGTRSRYICIAMYLVGLYSLIYFGEQIFLALRTFFGV